MDIPNLAEQIREALAMFVRADTQPALIGGLAVVAHQVVRATQDVDFLLEAEATDKVHDALLLLGYDCVHRNVDAANYVRGSEGLDLLYAHRPLARRLLRLATERDTPLGRLRVISVEGLTALDKSGELIHPDAILVRDAGLPYQPSARTDPIEQWLSLMDVVQMLCPTWPVRVRPMLGKY